MTKKSLIHTNPHLKDAKKRDEAMARNVHSSSAVEGITVKRDPETGRFKSIKKEEPTRSEKESSQSHD